MSETPKLPVAASSSHIGRRDVLSTDLTSRTSIGSGQSIAAHSSLDHARSAYRRVLELQRHPRNTIESYFYDLAVLEEMIGPKPINEIGRSDIAMYLGEANSKATRKRRLTSVRKFFRYLIEDAQVLTIDPTQGYYPHRIHLRTPAPLHQHEQYALLNAACSDEPWSLLAIWLMMRLGLTRAELLALERDRIDRTDLMAPVVHIAYPDPNRHSKDRFLTTNLEFATIYSTYLLAREIEGRLFVVGPQAVNAMVNRVRKAANIDRDVTPQTLRTTFAVECARAGADEASLLATLGLVDDPHNRQSVCRYLALAAESVSASHSA